MKKMTIDSTELRQLIIQEINLISDEEMAGLYQLVHYFRLGSQVASNGTMVSSNGYYSELLNSPEELNIWEDSTDEGKSKSTGDGNTYNSSTDESDIDDLEEGLRAQGWTRQGIFKDDPEFLKLFDEIEEERNRHWVGGE